MELKQLTLVGDDKTHIGVTGYSVIDHRIRMKLKLDIIDYIILDAIAQITVVDNFKFSGLDKLRAITGIEPHELQPMITNLIHTNWLIKNDKYMYIPCPLFLNSVGYDQMFEYLWRMFKNKGSLGNKAAAKKNYVKAIKVSPIKEIVQGAQNYWASKTEDTEFKIHLSTFLNPENKMWLDRFKKIETEARYKGNISNNG